ncbi:MAG: hypothetical protein ACFFB3_17895 [Candidatus Hodarchaeota archaeon]
MAPRIAKKVVFQLSEANTDHLKVRMIEDAFRVSQSAETLVKAMEGLNEVMERIRLLNEQLIAGTKKKGVLPVQEFAA